jgi:hypothetical protein
VVVDSAGESESTAKKMTETGLGSWAKNIRNIGELAGAKKADVEEIEGIFKNTEYIRLFEQHYAKAYPKCVLPTEAEILEQQKTASEKLTKTIDRLLKEMNPEMRNTDGREIGLDKTGISQCGYERLAAGDNSLFTKETENRFIKIFAAIEQTFTNEIGQEE